MKPTEETKESNFRRDARLSLGPGEGHVDVELESGSARGQLTGVSLSGLAVTFDSDIPLEIGTELPGARVQIGDSVMHGDLVILNVRRYGASELRVGGLFWPLSSADEKAWLSVVPRPEAAESAEPVIVVRCGSCHRMMYVTGSSQEGGMSVAACTHCSQQHMMPDLGLLRLAVTLEAAREVAREHRIDLPAAYSVFLGVLTAEQVLDTYASKPTEEIPATEDTGSLALEVDPDFQPAIQAGTLTILSAIQRGSRSALAARLVARHRLSESVALDVADNRTPLINAIRERGPGEPIQVVAPETQSGLHSMVLLVAALALVLFATGAFKSTWLNISADNSRGRAIVAEKRERVIASTETQLDEQGRVTEVRGSDPRHVLIAYCNKAGIDGSLTPVELVQPDPPENGVRLGIFTGPRHGGDRMAIRIERRGGARIWIAGGQGEPVVVAPAPDVPPLALRIPVD